MNPRYAPPPPGHETQRRFAGAARVASALRPFALLSLALAAAACHSETQWPLTCTPGESIGFRPDSGDHSAWRQWNWKAGDPFVLSRDGAAPNFSYRVEASGIGWLDAVCAAEADGKHVVCDSGERRMRLSVETLRFVVASETGYRDESNSPTFDRADVALGVCQSKGGGS